MGLISMISEIAPFLTSDYDASNGEHRESLSLMLLRFIVAMKILTLLFTQAM